MKLRETNVRRMNFLNLLLLIQKEESKVCVPHYEVQFVSSLNILIVKKVINHYFYLQGNRQKHGL